MLPLTLVVSALSLLSSQLVSAQDSVPPAVVTPAAPGLKFLYTAFVLCTPDIAAGQGPGPAGIRKTIPIVGGNVTGPLINGNIADVGADWGMVDPLTGVFSADTRYNVVTDDGAVIFLRTSGPTIGSNLHLRVQFETGSEKYYWLNEIITIGVLTPISVTAEELVLRIDTWHFADEPESSSFA
ncbi:hypothetical protein P152DRAFT_438613 [Eremomyces bilateralis CBS 781.70]|uniref:Uncharacterized protein n=1 Tax=Eremomyces bilateralis CBS 781.70 TaxID=1392243 RepID=A0A6G1FYM4_9PEZI|nr:uncharacterized protein P152DRAFT_438613 [Eremomyces bilateralis CBS 781.70]KAF1810947.1 hypothetical protein P152DRAFT_438613 [Eremomyces bilateralis CBS 781.70]